MVLSERHMLAKESLQYSGLLSKWYLNDAAGLKLVAAVLQIGRRGYRMSVIGATTGIAAIHPLRSTNSLFDGWRTGQPYALRVRNRPIKAEEPNKIINVIGCVR